MPTTVVSSIGTTARDYSTLQSWEDASPANLVSDDKIWRGEAYNDSEFVPAASFTISGSTTDATRYKELTAATGQSFQDHANVRTNALRYNASNGVGIRANLAHGQDIIKMSESYIRISRVQVKNDAGGLSINSYSGAHGRVKDCYCQGQVAGGNTSFTVINCVVLRTAAGAAVQCNVAITLIGCLLIKASNVSPAGSALSNIYGDGSACSMVSCAVFGFASVVGAASFINSSNNASDMASGLPGSSNQHSVTYSATTPFTQADNTGSLDLRSIAATSLAANGLLDGTNAPNDISAYVRANPPTIGHWEITAAGAAFLARRGLSVQQAVKRASYY